MNFEFLKQEWDWLHEPALEAEKQVFSSPRISAFYSRLALENGINWLYANDSSLKKPYQDNLSALMYEQSFQNLLPPNLLRQLTYIRKLGNNAAHQKNAPDSKDALAALRYLHSFMHWLVRSYGKTQPEIRSFNEESLIKAPVKDASLQEINKLQFANDEIQKTLKDQQAKQAENDQEKEKLRKKLEEVQERKRRNAKTPFEVEVPYTEAETRWQFIDVLLREAGWDPNGANVAEYEVKGMPNSKQTGYVDYVLWGDDNLPLAVVEAKRTFEDKAKGKRQAELYANCLEEMTGQRPVIFYTNGFDTAIWDDAGGYPPRPVQGFYTKDELQLLVNRRKTKKDLLQITPNESLVNRYYQKEALKRVAETLSKKARGSLLVMATGTGKTRTAAAIVDMLSKANWVRRALFLADRNALVTQAKNSFNDLLPHLTTVDLTKEKEDTTSRMVFSTYPTIMNRIDGERTEDNRYYGPGHFDLIIVDEAHRSVYMKYKAIFDYFDAITIGLTATPKSEVDKNTYELFFTTDHDPTYSYELKKAVDDKFLVPPKAVSVPIKFPREGIKYNELSDEDKAQYELTFRDEETGTMPDEIDSTALNNWLFNANTVDQVLAYIMEHGIKVEGGDKLGKTIIFAKSHKHAVFIQERFDLMFPQYGGKFLRIIDNYETYAQDLLDNFSQHDKMPQIAVSVDMLDTGIDVPEIVNLIFFKIIRSSSKFWQMIGRGTRLCKNLFGPGIDKKEFFIFDFCKNFEFFDQFPEGIEPPIVSGVTQRVFNNRIRVAEELREQAYHTEAFQNLRKELLDWCHSCVAKLDPNSFVVRAQLRFVDQFSKREAWDNLTTSNVIDIERHISHLILPYDDDEMARRFDGLMTSLQISIIDKSLQQRHQIQQVIRLAKDLSRKSNIPSVGEKMEIITQVQTSQFWEGVNLLVVERVREDLRALIKFVDKENQVTVYTNFEDEIDIASVETRDLLHNYQRLESYKQRVESYIRQNQNHITIIRLRNNEKITPSELSQLENMLFDGDDRGTKADFEREFGKQPLGLFIRSILGMDVNAAKAAFSEFLNKGNLSADQITFIDNIIDFFTKNGTIESSMLFEPPFTDINDQGLLGVFESGEAARIIKIIEKINENAMIA